MSKIVVYAPSAGDGDAAAAVAAKLAAMCGGLQASLLGDDLAPAIRAIMERRAADEIDDETFFSALSAAVAGAIMTFADTLCHEGEREFIKTLVLSISALLAHAYGMEVIPERDDVVKTVRDVMN